MEIAQNYRKNDFLRITGDLVITGKDCLLIARLNLLKQILRQNISLCPLKKQLPKVAHSKKLTLGS